MNPEGIPLLDEHWQALRLRFGDDVVRAGLHAPLIFEGRRRAQRKIRPAAPRHALAEPEIAEGGYRRIERNLAEACLLPSKTLDNF
jgi:hypothetical protein